MSKKKHKNWSQYWARKQRATVRRVIVEPRFPYFVYNNLQNGIRLLLLWINHNWSDQQSTCWTSPPLNPTLKSFSTPLLPFSSHFTSDSVKLEHSSCSEVLKNWQSQIFVSAIRTAHVLLTSATLPVFVQLTFPQYAVGTLLTKPTSRNRHMSMATD